MAGVASRLAPGPYVAVSCGVLHPGAEREEFIRAYTAARIWRHTVADIAGWLDGLEIVGPGVTDVRGWRAGMPEPRLAPRLAGKIVGAVARVP